MVSKYGNSVGDVVVIGKQKKKKTNKRLSPSRSPSTIQDILEGRLTLIDIQINNLRNGGTPTTTNKDHQYRAKGTFCDIDWSLQQYNPSTVPMFRDLQSQSTNCTYSKITVDLWIIVQKAKQYDIIQQQQQRQQPSRTVSSSPVPTGVVFHETRCGSTLVANVLSTLGRTYSESPPPIAALKACSDGRQCDPSLHIQLIRDVFYIMGREPNNTNNKNQQRLPYVFYKIQSVGTFHTDTFVEAMPTVPWIFVYRDTVEILQSHLSGKIKDDSIRTVQQQTPVCARYYKVRRQQQPPTTIQAIRQANYKPLEELSVVEYCAAHLAGLSLAAIHQYEHQQHQQQNKPHMGRFVNYKQLPDSIWTDLVPNHFTIPNEDTSYNNITRMQSVANFYSKGRGNKAQTEFDGDSQQKQSTAPRPVQDAARIFVDKIYQQMEALSSSSLIDTLEEEEEEEEEESEQGP
ncbi:aspartyl/asparaginyl beta-hydroxylase [Nitzschia inconspicua]|uniref:Aspartyl/asparaginyl beta-hydroxylase n=1 Tax=Nitzschia inconspicua TaxID=303405 RepID=A0A9K3KH30_9STRA|nr:aspartyl/asparaginyl beta-hydroxylase [Nitzschia inconspicua]